MTVHHMFSNYIDFGDSLDSLDPFDTSLTSLNVSQNLTDTFTASVSESSSELHSFFGHDNSKSGCTSQISMTNDETGPDIDLAGDCDNGGPEVDLPIVNAALRESLRPSVKYSNGLSKDIVGSSRWTVADKTVDLELGIPWELFDEL